MAYIMIGEHDYSAYCNGLTINRKSNYNAQTNAAGDTVVDFINRKREIEVGIIPLDDIMMAQLQNDVAAFDVKLSFRNPATNTLEDSIECIIPEDSVEYYTIQAGKILYKAVKLKFIEL